MKRVRQTLEEIEASLSRMESTWMDAHAANVIAMLKSLPVKKKYTAKDIRFILERDFKVGFTVIRLFMDQSKDEFVPTLKEALGPNGERFGTGIKCYNADPEQYITTLIELGLAEKIGEAMNRKLVWHDVLSERLKGGRGSATKGQSRGRDMENFVENLLLEVFTESQIAVRCRFTGSNGVSNEKTDFAIPSANDPSILIEAKAYGATGSKQTDVLGDIARIVEQKRHDTHFILVTDGITWKQRTNDLRKLLALQNEGKILKIYTKSMAALFKEDLQTLKYELGL